MTNHKVIAVIPAYNEEKNIAKVVKEVKNYVDQVVVVDDCSKDETAFLSQNQGAEVIKHLINRGQGAALETGNQYALKKGADIVVHFDADGQFLAKEIPEMIEPIKKEQADIVFGSRFLKKKSKIPWFKEKIIIPLARLVNKLFFHISLTDPQSGFRALSAKAVKEIKIENDRMAHCSEIMGKAFALNLRVKEVSTTVIYHNFGQSLGQGFKIVKDLFFKKLID